MNRRLPPQPGEWIDRSRPLEFQFEGETIAAFEGDVLSSALWANDVRLLGRSFKYHRPRGIYSLMSHDVNVMVATKDQFNLRGDTLLVEPGAEYEAVNTQGGVKRDRLRFMDWFGRFLPVGFYYKAFHTPRWLFPFYENQMRKVAGLGKIDAAARSPHSPKDYAFCDLLVVGAGPAGLGGAIAAAEQGLQVIIVDEQQYPGGSFGWQWITDELAQTQLQQMLQQIRSMENIELRSRTQVSGCYADHWAALVDDCKLTKLRSKATLVASGCFEQPAVFQNNDLPGVMLGSAAQRLMHLYAIKPCERAVVLAANSDGYRLALELDQAGVQVAAIIDLRSSPEDTLYRDHVVEQGIVVYQQHAIYEALPTAGKTGVRAAVVCRLDDAGNADLSSRMSIECDAIVMSVGWAPNASIYYQAGGRFEYNEQVEQLIPKADSPAGLFAAGRLNGVYDWIEQVADGIRAGLEAASFLGKYSGSLPAAIDHRGTAPSHPYPIVAHPGKKNFVDLDEDLHLADFKNAHQEGFDNIELLKRYTTVGMGPSQGKLSNMNAVRILARLNQNDINETGTTTARPFYQPVPLKHLAGRRFHPQRRTPLDAWHNQAGALMIHAGAWLRPEYYQHTGKTREDCIYDEACHVRQNVGLIDVSTLGKLEICGPDAARFLERIYTGRFVKQKPGSLRYGLACDETGVIIEDGVIARLDDERFYVTATSSGAAAFYREMQRWAQIWEMNVTLVNATGQLAAMNIAGPHSRAVLQQLTDLNLDAESFPYLSVQPANVAGVSALLLRVGFVGELGFEIHVPAASGLHVWNQLIEAGQQFGIKPFGMEAQRLLRLEKGHLIVGQDTDALTNPFEANAAWAIGNGKDFFVGGRSLEIAARSELTRILVGLSFPETSSGILPEECHLIIEAGEIVGRITSIARRSTWGPPLALAFVRPDLATPGTRVEIRGEQGTMIAAEVTKMPFYDPDHQRQNLPVGESDA
ncbi:2Fe-2S iron-sulfur cluster-binding protein [Gimesia sp.]|uniref:2Fe-2S iron-sulfur cluster-binding protein n=1 Tax=Gimesia sp. TaxID=2024833 RepID=UPI003A9599A6